MEGVSSCHARRSPNAPRNIPQHDPHLPLVRNVETTLPVYAWSMMFVMAPWTRAEN